MRERLQVLWLVYDKKKMWSKFMVHEWHHKNKDGHEYLYLEGDTMK